MPTTMLCMHDLGTALGAYRMCLALTLARQGGPFVPAAEPVLSAFPGILQVKRGGGGSGGGAACAVAEPCGLDACCLHCMRTQNTECGLAAVPAGVELKLGVAPTRNAHHACQRVVGCTALPQE